MKLSVVILTWNSEFHIEACLKSLIAHICDFLNPYEIFIVDNGSTDQSQSIIKSIENQYPKIIKSIFLDTNMGTTYSRNLAIKRTTGELLAIIDSDIILHSGVFERLTYVLRNDSSVGMAVPRLVYGSRKLQKSTDNFPTLFSKLIRYFFLKKIEKKLENKFIVPYSVDYAISAFWLLKKEVVQKVGFLDEKIFYAPEDVDYCLRLWENGFSIKYVPDVTVTHDAQEISRGLRINKAMIEHIKGLVYYFVKHRYFIRRPKFKDEISS